MLQNLCLLGYRSVWSSSVGDIHCPDLRTFTMESFEGAVESLISKPMPNVRHLRLIADGPVMLYIKLLNILPNFVSLKWIQRYDETVEAPNSRMAKVSHSCGHRPTLPRILLYSESLNLAGDATESIHVLNIIRQDWNVTLHVPEQTAMHAMLPHLTHLETLIVHPNCAHKSVDELLVDLSTHNSDFILACPQLKTVEINHGRVSTSALVGFVWRVKADMDDPVPGLMTSLKLSFILVDQDMCEQHVKTYTTQLTYFHSL